MSDAQVRRIKEILHDAEVIAEGDVLTHIRAALAICHEERSYGGCDPDDEAWKNFSWGGVGDEDRLQVHVGFQNGSLYLWCEVDTLQPMKYQTPLWCIGTGRGQIFDGCKHFQSIIAEPFVWHLYRKT